MNRHTKNKFLNNSGINILGEIKNPGTLEGGDVAWLNETTLAVGHTYRTNYEGIEQLRSLLKPLNVDRYSSRNAPLQWTQ